MPELLRRDGLRLIDLRYRKILTAFARLDNMPTCENEIGQNYASGLKRFRDDLKSYAQACERHSIGGHEAGRSGCELSGKHRVCCITITPRKRILWLAYDFAGEALVNEDFPYCDPRTIAARTAKNKI